MRSRPLLVALALGCLPPAACFFDGSVPDGARLSCLVQEDCPPGYTCREAIGVCVEASQIDADAPRLEGEPVLDPDLGSIGDSFVLSFAVNEPLFGDPVVTLDAGDREAPFTLDADASDSDALEYVYTYTADGSEAQGAREITIAVADEGGNAAELPGGLLNLDFVAPRITAVSISPEVIGAGATATLSLILSEPAEGFPAVVMASDGGASLTWTHVSSSADGLQHELSYIAGGTEAEAVYPVTATASDAAGNSSAAEEAGTLTLDFTAPTVVDRVVAPGELVSSAKSCPPRRRSSPCRRPPQGHRSASASAPSMGPRSPTPTLSAPAATATTSWSSAPLLTPPATRPWPMPSARSTSTARRPPSSTSGRAPRPSAAPTP